MAHTQGSDQISLTEPDSRVIVLLRNKVNVGCYIQASSDEKYKLLAAYDSGSVNNTQALAPMVLGKWHPHSDGRSIGKSAYMFGRYTTVTCKDCKSRRKCAKSRNGRYSNRSENAASLEGNEQRVL